MATDFFERQRRARAATLWLRLAFVLGMVVASVLAAVGLLLLLTTIGLKGLAAPHAPTIWSAFAAGGRGWWVAGFMLAFMLVVAGVTAWRLRGGGASLARALRARQLHPESQHPLERRLLNIVTEMSLASQLPEPGIYVLDREEGINAFAAGRDPRGAVIGVTAGALRDLDRDELQAVIAHEFSHILNGDMALNTRIVAWLSGLFAIERVARALRRDPDRKAGMGVVMFWYAHVGAWLFHACGYIGLLIGRVLQAAICRRREALADASAVQFTRNGAALKSALLKIEAAEGAGRIHAGAAVGMAHMFFSQGDRPPGGFLRSWTGGWLRTHPPTEERVRALDQRMSGAQFRAAVRNERKRLLNVKQQAEAPVRARGEVLNAPPVAPLVEPDPPDLLTSRLADADRRAVLDLQREYATPGPALAGLFVAAFLEPGAERARLQLLALVPLLGAGIASRVPAALNRLAGIAPQARLPLLVSLLPQLQRLPAADLAGIVKVARAVALQVPPDETLSFAASRLTLRALAHAETPAAPAKPAGEPPVQPVAELALLCTLVARCSGDGAERAWRAAMDGLIPPLKRPAWNGGAIAGKDVDAALARVATLPYLQRSALAAALLRAIAAHDDMASAAELDLLRLVCTSIGIHTPPIGRIRPEPAARRSAIPAAGGS